MDDSSIMEGTSLCPPLEQFSITSSGISSARILKKSSEAATVCLNPSPKLSAPSQPIPMLSL